MDTVLVNHVNYEKLLHTKLENDPFEYMVVSELIKLESVNEVVADFPNIKSRGSFPLDTVDCGKKFLEFIAELKGETFRTIIEKKFSINLANRPIMITARGQCEDRDGQIHIDSKGKLITVLVYLNKTWDNEGGKLRLLRNEHDLEDYVAEVTPLAGTMIIFKCTDNAWHGHHPFTGARNAIQLNWVVDNNYLEKERIRHKVSAFFKKIKRVMTR